MISLTEPRKFPNFNQINFAEPKFLNQPEILPVTKYISFGWGDREFYIHTQSCRGQWTLTG
jgi:hypothetical protein